MATPQKLTALFNMASTLCQYDRDTVGSLMGQYTNRGTLTDKQWNLVDVIYTRVTAPKTQIADEASMASIKALFDKAGAKLKRPKILLASDVGTLVLTVANAKSNAPGAINIKSRASYGESEYYGRIMTDGSLRMGFNIGSKRQPVIDALSKFAADPAGVAAAYGRQTSECCFCALDLVDPRSTSVGYGPICARNYGLPWGECEVIDEQPTEVNA